MNPTEPSILMEENKRLRELLQLALNRLERLNSEETGRCEITERIRATLSRQPVEPDALIQLGQAYCDARKALEAAKPLLPPGRWYEEGSPADEAARVHELIRDALNP